MPDKVYIVGHKNPDTDSVASAIAYAHLKNEMEKKSYHKDLLKYVPAVLSPINKETEFVLNYFAVGTPKQLAHIKMRAKDGMSSRLITATPQTSLREVGDLLYANNIRSVPVVNEDGHPQGIVTERNIAHRYVEEVKVRSLERTPVNAKRVVDTLNGEIITGEPDSVFGGNVVVAAMQPETMVRYIKEGDIVIVGNREDAQETALRQKASCLVITGNVYPSGDIMDLAKEMSAAIMLSSFDTFATAKLINLSIPVEGIMEKDFLTVDANELFSELIEDVLNSENRLVLVVDHDNCLLGIITRQDLVHPLRRRAILVDHNEKSQSVSGIEEAQILEIVDHHRLGDIQTAEPILVINEPVGATSTIVFGLFKESDIVLPKEIAGTMLGAILSDTVLLKSPTTTDKDKLAVDELAAYVGVDATEFGVEMYRQASDIASVSARDLIFSDFKLYEFNDMKLGIGQFETIDLSSILARKEEILDAMNQVLLDRGYYGLVLMVTDILKEGTELLVVGKTKVAEKAFGKKLVASSLFLPGVISRKKQVAPPLARALAGK